LDTAEQTAHNSANAGSASKPCDLCQRLTPSSTRLSAKGSPFESSLRHQVKPPMPGFGVRPAR